MNVEASTIRLLGATVLFVFFASLARRPGTPLYLGAGNPRIVE